jgi:hypothetical protein
MDITTIKLRKGTKSSLDHFKKKEESYDRAIKRMLVAVRQKRLREQLAEGYKEAARRDKHLVNEWEAASREIA